MAFSSNPKIPNEGLVLLLDAADLTSARTVRSVEVMVVGGGGGGGMDMGGGGGGGGVLYDPNYKVTPGVGITVTVGAGGFGAPAGGGYRTDGAGQQPGAHQFTVSATNGSDSVFGNLIAKGGGFGASSYYGYAPNSGIGGSGASGGGCSAYTHGGERYVDTNNIVGQGYPGGNSGNPSSGADDHYSGGGGGAGGRGTSGPNHVAPSGTAGHGGPGIIIPRMSPYYYSGGGGGSCYSGTKGGDGGLGGGGGGAAGGNGNTVGFGDTNGRNAGGNGGLGNNQPGGNAGANTGGGGGGGSHYNVNNKGGEGGSGIVIIRYNGPQAASGGTYTFVNGVSFHTFTSSGTFTPNSTHTTWYDTSGKGNNASLENGISYSSLNSGTMVLDGTNDVIYAPSVNSFGGIPNHTFIVWVKSPGLGPGKYVGGLFCPDYGMITYIAADGNIVYYLYNSSTSSYVSSIGTSGVNAFDNKWHHLAFTRADNSPARIYVDGVLKVSSGNTGVWPGTTAWSGMNIQIGNNPNDAYYNLLGNIAVAKMYKRELSASEILQSYNVTKTRFGL